MGLCPRSKSANRSSDDKVWTPGKAARGESRHDVESSRPQADVREVSAVRSTDFPAGPRGIEKGERGGAPFSRSRSTTDYVSAKLVVNGTIHQMPDWLFCRMVLTLIRPANPGYMSGRSVTNTGAPARSALPRYQCVRQSRSALCRAK